MTNTIPNVPRELKPCPFCGDTPELPSGDGTQYEIECAGCGQAMASVQICDLMTLEERVADAFTDYRYGEEFVERAKVQAIEHWNNRAPSPAGVDGLEVVATLLIDDPTDQECGDWDIEVESKVAERMSEHGGGQHELCRLSDATAIIDGLRGKNEQIRLNIAEYNESISCYQSERDQHAQRIGELKGLLREVRDTYRAAIHWEDLRGTMKRIDAALSAGKEGE